MLSRLSRFVEGIATGRLLLGLVLLVLLFPTVLFPAIGPSDVRPLDLYPTYSPVQAHAWLEALGDAGRRAYVRMEATLDMIFPLLYALALAVASALLLRRFVAPASAWRRLALLPLLIVPADWIENLGLVAATLAFPRRLDLALRIAGAATALKWILLALSATLVVVLAITLARGRWRGRTDVP